MNDCEKSSNELGNKVFKKEASNQSTKCEKSSKDPGKKVSKKSSK